MSAPDKEKEKDKEETNQKSEDLGLLEEDDEFEEFPAEGKNLFLFLMKVYRIIRCVSWQTSAWPTMWRNQMYGRIIGTTTM